MADDLQKFAGAIGAYMRSKKVDAAKAMKAQFRLLVQRIIAFTPPRTLAQGRRRVQKDVKKATGLLDPEKFEKPYIQRLIQNSRYEQLTNIFARFGGGRLKGTVVGPFGEEHIDQHQKSRDRRGRVRKSPKIGVAHTKPREANAYVKRVQGNVGMAKGGWARALLLMGGKPANWYARHSDQGEAIAELDHPTNPFFKFSNRSPWANQKGAETTVRNAINSRTEAIRESILRGHMFAIRNRLKRLNRAA